MSGPTEVYIKQVRLSYPHLFEKQKAAEDAKPKYSAAFLIDPTTKIGKQNITKIKAAIEAAEEKKWKKTGFKYREGRCCFFDGNDNVDDEGNVKPGYEDMMVIKASNERPVDLRHRNKSKVDWDDERDTFYGGCYVEAILRLFGTENGGSKGVFATLELVRFHSKGDPFGAPPVDDSILDDLDDLDDEDEDEDEGEDDLLD